MNDKLQEISDKVNELMDEYIAEIDRVQKENGLHEKTVGAVMVKVRDGDTWLKAAIRELK